MKVNLYDKYKTLTVNTYLSVFVLTINMYILQGTLDWFKLPPISQDINIFTTNT